MLNMEDAVIMMQRWRTLKLAVRAGTSGMTSAIAKAIEFSELSSRLRDAGLIKTMKLMLHRVCVLTAAGVKLAPDAENIKNVNVRVFLASFMIAFHEAQVFEAVNGLERDLIKAALAMLEVFDELCGALRALPPGADPAAAVEAALTFPKLLHAYLTAFQAWKRPDEVKLTKRIKHALLALYQAEAHLEESDPETHALRAGFRGEQARLRAKLLQIAGEQALQAVDAARAQQQGAAPPPVAGAAVQAVEGGGEGAYSALPKRVTNEQLAHELLLDPKFKIDENGGCGGENPVHSKIRGSFHVAFWESLADDLRLEPPCYARVVKVLTEVRDGIADLAQGSAARRVADRINDVLDMDLIKQQIDRGFEWRGCVKLIQDVVSILTQVEAAGARPGGAPTGGPAGPRDPAAKVRWEEVDRAMQAAAAVPAEQPGAFCAALSYLLDRVRAVRIDVANSRLRLVSSEVRRDGIRYLRTAFQRKMDEGEISETLERTRAWLEEAMRRGMNEKYIELQDLTSDGQPKHAEFLAVLCAATAALVTGATAPRAADCPETLLLDVARLGALHARFNAIVNAAAVLAVLGQVCKELPILENVANAVLAVPAGNKAAVVEAVMQALQGCEQKGALSREMVEACTRQGNEVYLLLHRRLSKALSCPNDTFRNVQTTLAAYEELQLPQAAQSLAPHIVNMVQLMCRVVYQSMLVHVNHYKEMIPGIARELPLKLLKESEKPAEEKR